MRKSETPPIKPEVQDALFETTMNNKQSAKLPQITKDAEAYPSVTIAIPVLNEAENIEQVVRGFSMTKYPNLVEIFIADGGSKDETQNIVNTLSQLDPRVKLLYNPLRIQGAGLNLILQKCTGDIFLRADAHAEYASDYIERCVEALLASATLNVGGAQRFVASTPFQAGVALASRSWLGNGGAKYRDPNYDGYGDTVYLGCFWRKNLLDVSGYRVEVTHGEDNELNYRLCDAFDTLQVTNQSAQPNQKLSGGDCRAIYISSKIKVWYYPRKTWKSLWNQYFKYGESRYQTAKLHPTRSQLRGKLPLLFASFLIAMLLIDELSPEINLYIKEFVLVGLLVVFLESLVVCLRFHRNFTSEFWRGSEIEVPSLLTRCLFCTVAILTMPIAYASGYFYKLISGKCHN